MDFFVACSSLVSNAETQKDFRSLDNKHNAVYASVPRAQTHYPIARALFRVASQKLSSAK